MAGRVSSLSDLIAIVVGLVAVAVFLTWESWRKLRVQSVPDDEPGGGFDR